MRIHIGADHAAFELTRQLVATVRQDGHEVVDHGPLTLDPLDDYPVFVLRAAQGVAQDLAQGVDALGVVLGGSGNGEQMAANKVVGIRAALCWTDELAKLAREHNNAQVISIGGRVTSADLALQMVRTFIATPFSGEERHTRRLEMVSVFEREGVLPPLPETAKPQHVD